MNTPVLMVEDDQATGEVLSEVLNEAGYAVTLAPGGTRALELLKENVFAVIVTDIRMPAVNGIDVLHAARETDSQPEVILLTGYGSLDTSLAALREGAFDYLLKPCDPELLIQRVGEAIESREARLRQAEAVRHIVDAFGENGQAVGSTTATTMVREPEIATETDEEERLHVGALSFGSAHHTATFQGQPLHLTPTEFSLLRTMAEKLGKVFTYRELVYAMHDYDVSSAEAKVLLKTHVRNIRHKIGSGYLVNVRSTGYKLVVPDPTSTPDDDEDDEDDDMEE